MSGAYLLRLFISLIALTISLDPDPLRSSKGAEHTEGLRRVGLGQRK